MIERPPGGLGPQELATLRRAGVTLFVGTFLAVAVGLILASADVGSSIAAAVMFSVVVATAAVLVFGVFKVQRFAPGMRRDSRALPRGEKLKRWFPSLVLTGLIDLAIWKLYGDATVAAVLAALLGVGVVGAIVDVWRGPRE